MALDALPPSRPVRVTQSRWAAAVLGLITALGVAVAQERAIELRDGSVLLGELVGAGNGHYRIRTQALGEIDLPESQVLAVRSVSAAPSAPSLPSAGPSDLLGIMVGIQQQMAGDPTLASTIAALQGDPELRAVLADPAFTELIRSGNLVALSTDPRFLRLMANPAIQSILGQVGGQLGGQTLGR